MVAAPSYVSKPLKIGEVKTIRDSYQDGILAIERLKDGVSISETLDNVEQSVYVNLRELALIMYLTL
jgi:hypothetical protein